MALFQPRCPVEERERAWIEENLRWLRAELGDGPLTAPVILPTSDFFPPPYSGTDEDVVAVVTAVARYMGVRDRVDVDFTDDYDHAQRLMRLIPGGMTRSAGAAGTYSKSGRRPVLTIDRSGTREPARLLAVIAHELGHARLLGERRVTADRRDHEPLTDLATVYLGMGIFTANAAFEFGRLDRPDGSGDPYARSGGWQARRLGYLTEQMFGYALARWTLMRGQPGPAWARYLDTNPRVYMKNGVKYIQQSERG